MRRLRNVRAAYALLMTLLAASSVQAASDVVGDWQGAIDTGRASLRVVIHLAQGKDGNLAGTMDSPDQNAAGIVISSVSYKDTEVRFTIDQFGIGYVGKLDKDQHQIVGVWKQGPVSLPLTLSPAPK